MKLIMTMQYWWVVARRGGPNPPISGNSRFRTCTQGGHSATGPRHRHRTWIDADTDTNIDKDTDTDTLTRPVKL